MNHCNDFAPQLDNKKFFQKKKILLIPLYTLNIYAHFSSHFSPQLLMAEI